MTWQVSEEKEDGRSETTLMERTLSAREYFIMLKQVRDARCIRSIRVHVTTARDDVAEPHVTPVTHPFYLRHTR